MPGEERPWWQKPMRIAALQVGSSSDPFKVLDTWAEAGFNVEQLLHPMGRGYHAVFDPERHAALLTRYSNRAHAKGLRVILYLNTHILSPEEAHAHPEWVAREAAGSTRISYGTFPAVCINSGQKKVRPFFVKWRQEDDPAGEGSTPAPAAWPCRSPTVPGRKGDRA